VLLERTETRGGYNEHPVSTHEDKEHGVAKPVRQICHL
jgi:hypothetical protein